MDPGESAIDVSDGEVVRSLETIFDVAAAGLVREREAQEVAAAKSLGSLVKHDDSPPRSRVDGRWEHTRRSDIDLAIAILAGSYDAQHLVRHVRLNPGEIPVDDEKWLSLADLLGRLAANGREVRACFRQTGLADRRAVLERGDPIPELEIESAPDQAAERIVAYYGLRGEHITIEEAKARLRRREAFSVKMPSNSSYIRGKLYRNSDFGKLETSDRSFEYLRQLALEEAALIVGWFTTYGYTDFGPEVMEVFRRIETVTRAEFEQLAK